MWGVFFWKLLYDSFRFFSELIRGNLKVTYGECTCPEFWSWDLKTEPLIVWNYTSICLISHPGVGERSFSFHSVKQFLILIEWWFKGISRDAKKSFDVEIYCTCRILCLENKQVTITNCRNWNGFLFTYIDQPTNQITNQLAMIVFASLASFYSIQWPSINLSIKSIH